MSAAEFKVLVSDYTSSAEEWQRAQRAPKSELPQLTEEQRAVARGFKITEEDYARGVLAGSYGRERQRNRGKLLGEEIQRMLDQEGAGSQVVRVAYQTDRLRWLVSVQTPGGIANVAVPRELADDVVDSGLWDQIDALRARVASALGAHGKAMQQ